jgi:Cu(I)/Ag(I) efflux system membrane fusion protein
MNKYLKYILTFILLVSVGVGAYFYFQKSGSHTEHSQQEKIYTCSMHPQIIRKQPGNCPICGMTLVEKVTKDHSDKNDGIDPLLKPTDNFIVGNFETTTAKDTTINNEIVLPGIVAFNPNSATNIAARVNGRIEKLYVNYKFQRISKGQKLFEIYSPELLTEQQNFIYLITNDVENTAIIKAAKQKLLLYGMTANQINGLMATKKTNPTITIYSPAAGIVMGTDKMADAATTMTAISTNTETLDIKEGSYITKGDVIFKLMNIDKVWGVFNMLQGSDNSIKMNQPIAITSELDENDTINAQINFVETQLDQADRTNKIRVYLNNNTLKLPVGSRLQGIVKVTSKKALWLHKESLVSLGNKKVVFLKMKNGFKATAIKTGTESSNYVQVLEGIAPNDTIAKNAQFLIDSESFIKTE